MNEFVEANLARKEGGTHGLSREELEAMGYTFVDHFTKPEPEPVAETEPKGDNEG